VTLPAALLASLDGLPSFNRQAFIDVHEAGRQVVSIRANPYKPSELSVLQNSQSVPWATAGHYLPERPSFTFDPAFHGGAYYVQEASSMFLEQALRQTLDLSQPLTVLDLCAAPGGKSTHIQSLLSADSVLVTNEVIRARVTILAENITKWGAANCIVTNNDPKDFSTLHQLFDAIVVDAPCSGSGLFRKDANAIAEWSEDNVRLCSQRQQRILADIWPALKPGGVLIYSTCSYSEAEDEAIADWLTDDCQATNIPLQLDAHWGMVETASPIHQNKGYRFYPYNVDGEGFYLSCFKKEEGQEDAYSIKPPKNQPDKKVVAAAQKWIKPDSSLQFYQHQEQVFCMPANTLQLFLQLQKPLNIRKAGIKLGDWARDEIIPDHALALSTIFHPDLPQLGLDRESAIQYLQKKDFAFDSLPKGWLMITFQGIPLGWIKSMGNRINNYYPKEWRIRKEGL
jgi:16S rRNA C967 or C1407 C5-methylase (RsmB/RsmF family)/NOL1/NOP2/fmu family ribosome biogenesis protein